MSEGISLERRAKEFSSKLTEKEKEDVCEMMGHLKRSLIATSISDSFSGDRKVRPSL